MSKVRQGAASGAAWGEWRAGGPLVLAAMVCLTLPGYPDFAKAGKT